MQPKPAFTKGLNRIRGACECAGLLWTGSFETGSQRSLKADLDPEQLMGEQLQGNKWVVSGKVISNGHVFTISHSRGWSVTGLVT